MSSFRPIRNVPNNSDQPITTSTVSNAVFTASSNQIQILPGGTGHYIYLTATNPSANRTITIGDPGGNDSLCYLSAPQTLYNKAIDSATSYIFGSSGNLLSFVLGGANGSSVSLYFQNTSAGVTYYFPIAADTLVGRASTDTLTNKTLTSPNISAIVNTGTLTLPTSTDTLVGRATTDTLTNKTLTNPTINSISVTGNVLQGDTTTQSLSTTWSGPFTSGSVTLTYRIINGVVHLRLPGVTGTSTTSATMTASAVLPVGYRPTVAQYFPFYVVGGGSYNGAGGLTVNTTGALVVYAPGLVAFAASGNVGYLDQSISFPTY